ncbi:YedE-related selenium metabolism membrane protein [candidate division WOR-3 bacterium]|nr:YedE-related selenium metabolism membrane protein [candidate division WOR-3 bacterium]
MSRFWSSRKWIILAGLIFGVLAALMTNWGNPANMGICVACFIRDIAGALGLHRASAVQYIRPEIIGFLLGAFITSIAFREWRARGGSSPLIRFLLGAFVTIGALIFLGCPIRMTLRLAGGDLNGVTALAGMVVGIGIGIFFLKRGFNLGRLTKMNPAVGWIMPILMLGLFVISIFQPGFIFASGKGPGAMFTPLWVSLGAGLGVGFLAQRTRMCFVGGWRDLFLVKNSYLFSGVAAFFIAALVTNYAAGNFAADGLYHWGFVNQPVAHNDHLWNFFGMSLVGLAVILLGGCPLRQLILTGEGDTDAGITVLGMFAGAASAHNFLLASGPQGTSDLGPVAVIIGLTFCLALGFLMTERAK